MRLVYPCDIVLDEEEREATGREAYTVTFPDVYGSTTGGWSWEEALENAEDALVAALGSYYYLNEDIPLPSPVKEGQQPIAPRPVAAAKVALNAAMYKSGVTRTALAEKLGITAEAAYKLCNPDHYSHISSIDRALKVVGVCLVIEAVDINEARQDTAPLPAVTSVL